MLDYSSALWLEQLATHGVRNLVDLKLNLGPKFNVFYGNNGSGKTSVLEAIYLLSRARSFRCSHSDSIITYSQPKFSVFGLLNTPLGHQRLGIEREHGGRVRMKINGEATRLASQLAEYLPIQLMTPDSYKLLNDGPKYRRQFVDWGCFHHNPRFNQAWSQYQRALQQRNAALKQQAPLAEVKLWDIELIESAKLITEARKQYLADFMPLFYEMFAHLLVDCGLAIEYALGWPGDLGFEAALAASLPKDRAVGHTGVGPHRADITLLIDHIPAQEILSRGQQKLLVAALHLAQGSHLQLARDKSCVFLLDDLTAELDADKQNAVISVLRMLKSQVFITSVTAEPLDTCLNPAETQMFHVKQGQIDALGVSRETSLEA